MSVLADLELSFFSRRKVPVVLQSEMAECGLACVAMVASYHGYESNIEVLRREWSVSSRGVTLSRIMEISKRLFFASRAVRLDLDSMAELRVPCILHWNMDHFVVLEAVGRHSITIVDPAIGRRKVGLEEVSSSFTGVALELVPSAGFVKKEREPTLRFKHLFRNTSGLLSAFSQVLAFSVAIQLMALLMPFYSQIVIDEVLVSNNLDLLTLLFVSFVVLLLLQTAFSAFRSWVIIYIGMKITVVWSSRLFFHLIRLPMTYFSARHIGDIQSRYGSLAELQDLVTKKVVESIIDGAMTVMVIIVLFLYDSVLASIVVGSTLLYLVIRACLFPSLKSRSRAAIIANAKKESFFLETIRGILTIKSFSMEHRRESVFLNRLTETINRDVRVFRIGLIEAVANQLIYGLQFLLVIWLAARNIVAGEFTVGMLVAFLAYRSQFSDRSSALVDTAIEFKLARVHLDRLSDIVDVEPEPGLVANDRPAIRGQGRIATIVAQDVSFRYAASEPYVLRDANISIRAGEFVALTGPSGAGKTTLLKLLMGLFPPSSGVVLLDGLTITEFGAQHYRGRFSAVLQDDMLLSGTLSENISFFDPVADLDKVIECAKAAGIHEDICRTPMQYFTAVGDMGTALSGGQRQRLLLARALYQDPEILYLDEACSHLDIDAEKQVIAALKKRGISIVSAAHREESIRQADRVVQLDVPGLKTVTSIPDKRVDSHSSIA